MEKWAKAAQAEEDPDAVLSSDIEEMVDADTELHTPKSFKLPCKLVDLFCGDIAEIARAEISRTQRRAAFSTEARQLELINADWDGEAPDDGEMEGSGDDYDG